MLDELLEGNKKAGFSPARVRHAVYIISDTITVANTFTN